MLGNSAKSVKSPVTESFDSNGRRNPRRGGSAKISYEDNETTGTNSSLDIDKTSSKDDEDDHDEDEDDDLEEDQGKKPTRAKTSPNRKRSKSGDKLEPQGRRSARSTKFTSSMKDPKDDVDDLFESVTTLTKPKPTKKGRERKADVVEAASPSKGKSQAVQHSTQRRRVETAVHMSTDEDKSEEGSDEELDDDENGVKIQRILACKTLTRNEWKKVCEKMNTSEVECGSRWFQEEHKEVEVLGDNTFEERFLVKWAELSYLHSCWETEADLVDQVENAKAYFTTFFRKSKNGILFSSDERCDGDFFDPGYIQIDRVLQVHIPDDKSKNELNNYGIIMDRNHKDYEGGTGRQFLIKWTNMPYSEATFEFERDLILNDVDYEEHVKEFFNRGRKPTKADIKQLLKQGEDERRRTYKIFGDNSKVNEKEQEDMVSSFQKELADVVYPNGGQLRDYQAEGVSWMLANLINQRCSILADEMGLGKTLQTCSFIDIVANRLKKRGPFLVIAPLSTLEHWHREFTSWTGLNTIIYHGSAKDRELIREHEFAFDCDKPKSGVAFNSSYLKKCMPTGKSKLERQWMVQVVITTPELLVADDFSELTEVEWEVLVVDEAHRLKNHNSKLAINLRHHRFQFNHTLLLTGTPIQNDMKELWTLLNFINPERFGDVDSFLKMYGDIKSKEKIDELHESIRPFILRRLKEDVEKSVPPKEETLIEVELTVIQKQYYRALYEKNVQFLHRNKKKALDGPSISNLAMQLRKCCNHPFLLRGVEDDIRAQEASTKQQLSEGDFLVKFSGKLVLLDKLLPRLKETGHRVLIFSQFKIMLDIIEDYLSERKMKAERIDGSITGKKRQMAIDRFQANDIDGKEPPFVMMLSTRAGGVGINLTAADTCIIFDSDWNPQNDLQAQARCHRIGQTKMVKVYRLLTRKTYEMQMFHMSSMKMGLDQAVLGGFESKDGSGEGAMTKEEVERLLRHGAYDIFNEDKAGVSEAESRAFEQQDIDSILERRSKTIIHENTGSQHNAAGSTFSKASFKAPQNPDSKKSDEDIDIDDPDFWRKMVGESQVENEDRILGRQKRTRREANYCEKVYQKQLDRSLSLSESEVDDGSSASLNEDSSDDSDDYGLDDVSSAGNKPKTERARWRTSKTRSGRSQWNKTDAEKLFKGLQLYGYGCMPWVDYCNKVAVVGYQVDEARRLCWALLLTTLREAVTDDFLNAQKRAVHAAEKKREDEGKSDDFDSGILAQTDSLLAAAATIDIEVCFKKLWEIHRPWIGRVLDDARRYARTHHARPKASLLRAITGRSGNGERQVVNAVFAQNVWPALKSRGWTIDLVESETESTTRYVKGDQSFRTMNAVLGVVPEIHPELAGMVESIQISLAAAAHESDEATLGDDFFTLLLLDTINFTSLGQLLDSFAPLTLLVDRTTPKKIALPRKVLSQCAYMKVAHDIVGPLVTTSFSEDTLPRMSSRVSIDRRRALPHPQWTQKHDAVLIYAVAKHGWIEHDVCIRDITEDKSIKWGAPFDAVEPNEYPGGESKISEDELEVVFNTATRASAFLNHEQETYESLKGFKEQLLASSLGLVRVTPSQQDPGTAGDGLQGLKWKADPTLMRKAVGAARTNGIDDQQGDAPESIDLPTKKDLLRRARAVLTKSPENSVAMIAGKKEEVSSPIPVKIPQDHVYSVLDQRDPGNLFLAELLRTLVKVSFNNSGKRKNIGRRLCTYALDESQQRAIDLGSLFEKTKNVATREAVETMKMIVDHMMLVSRFIQTKSLPAKNVLRAILGSAPQIPKNRIESMFPTDLRSLAINVGDVPTATCNAPLAKSPSFRSKKPRNESAIGDQAISLAMSKALGLSECSEQPQAGGPSESSLQLTTPETLLLTVMGSQGLPVWSCDWNDIIEGETLPPDLQRQGHECMISWDGMGRVFEAAAELWHTTALAKLNQRQSDYNEKYGNNSTDTFAKNYATKKLCLLKKDAKAKWRALAIAVDYANNPRKLAKKCIMLVEALRKKMGPIDLKQRGMKSVTIRQSEHGLGPYVLHWFGKENTKWADSFEIVDGSGMPYGYTAIDFLQPDKSGNPDDCDIAAVLDEKGCRSIFSQIAQQTRARSLFQVYDKSLLQAWMTTAVNNCDSPGDEWEGRPSWWCKSEPLPNHDFALMENLLLYGFSGIDEPLSLMSPVGASANETSLEIRMSRGTLQDRANQLTRELHMIEETAEAMQKLLSSRRDVSTGAPPLQSDIHSFFGTTTPTRSDSKYIDIVEVDSPPSSAKRKEPTMPASDLIEAIVLSSPQKKTKSSL